MFGDGFTCRGNYPVAGRTYTNGKGEVFDWTTCKTERQWYTLGYLVKEGHRGFTAYTNGTCNGRAQYFTPDDVHYCPDTIKAMEEESAQEKRKEREEHRRIRTERLQLFKDEKKRMAKELRNVPNKGRFFLFFDTETTGLHKNDGVVQLAWLLTDEENTELMRSSHITNPGFITSDSSRATAVHHITQARIEKEGVSIYSAIGELDAVAHHFNPVLVAHNIPFDMGKLEHHAREMGSRNFLKDVSETVCTMESCTEFCAIETDWGLKWPSLQELHVKLFGLKYTEAHDAMADVEACRKCFFELSRLGVIKTLPHP